MHDPIDPLTINCVCDRFDLRHMA